MDTYPKSCFLVNDLVLLMIFYKCEMLSKFSSDTANHYTIRSLLQNLAIKNESSCQIVSSAFLTHYEESFGVILDILIDNAVKFNPPITEWIFAVPLLHFVTKRCVPHQQLKGISLNDSEK